jgi:hypothetical protein
LLDVIKRRAEKREQDEEKRKRERPRKPFQLAARQSAVNLQLSPDEKSVFVTVNEQVMARRTRSCPNYVTETSYTEDIGSRSKVGDSQNRSRLAIVAVDNGEVKWVDHGQKQPPPAAEKQTAEQGEGEARGPQAGTRGGQGGRPNEPRDRDVSAFAAPLVRRTGQRQLLPLALPTTKTDGCWRSIPPQAKTRVIVNEHDDAWVDGPGAFTLGWMKTTRAFTFNPSEPVTPISTSVPYEGGEPKPLTSGKWEVSGVQMSDDKSRFLLTTSEVHPGERHFYSMPAEGGERTKITAMPGSNQTFLSPDEKMLALIYSYSNKPPELYIAENRPGAEAKKITSSPRPSSGTTRGSIHRS